MSSCIDAADRRSILLQIKNNVHKDKWA